MPILPIAIRNKQAVYTGSVPYVCSNSDYEVVFTFDAEWEEHPQKTVRFCAGGQCVERIITGNTCPVPVLDEGAFMQVGVYAGNLQTSTAAMIRMCGSIRSIGGAPAEPEPSVYDQIMEMLESMDISGSGGVSAEKLKTAVEEALTQAKQSGDFKGDIGDPGYTPQKGVDYFDGAKGDPGSDYILTEADKTEIAEEAAALVDAALLNLIGEVE